MFNPACRSLAQKASLILLLASPLFADGLEVAAGVAMGPTRRNAIPRSGDNTTALQLRVGWDQSPSQLRMDQWQIMAQAGSSETVRFVVAGLGGQHSWWTERHGAQAALGGELRVERFQGHSSLAGGASPLASTQAWMVRPWLRAQVGFRGLLLPLPSPAMEALHWLTQGGRYTHPFTRLEMAVPLWQQGGQGPSGALRQMAPRWEGSIQFGVRFGDTL